MSIIDTVFKRDINDYTLNMVPTKNYVKQMSKYISVRTGKDIITSRNILNNIIKKSDKHDPIVKYRHRDDVGDRTMKTTTLTNYINDVISNNEILAPSFTVLDHPDKKRSLHSEFLSDNIKKRKSDKLNAFKYKQQNNIEKSNYYNVLQKVRKIFNNSLSGAYASPSTIIYHPSAHSVLTSMTRSVASIGNAITESMVAGNKLLRTPEITINYIVSIITEVNTDDIKHTVDKFKLHHPTVDEVFDMLLYSFKNYWRDSDKEKNIMELLKSLDSYQLASIMYVNDLFNLKKYNNEFVKVMLTRISKKVTYDNIEPLSVISKANDGVMNLVHHICMDELKGKEVNYKKIDKETLMLIGATTNNVINNMMLYKNLFRTFYTTNILPSNIAEVKEMLRDVIVLSDTDSTCGSYDSWVTWYFDNPKFSSAGVAIAATVMTITTQVMDHNIKIFAKNMNADNSLIDLLNMKNEFFWSSFITANVSKHYYADIRIQEGNVYENPELELKGVHLIASTVSSDIRDTAYNLIKDINNKLANNEPIYPNEVIEKVLVVEQLVIEKIKQGDINIFKAEKIKPLDSYKLSDPGKTNYFNHILWNDVFKNKYGDPGEPEYRVIKVNTTINNKQSLNMFIDGLDTSMGNALRNLVTKYDKKNLNILRVPVAITGSRGIPKEILEVIDIHKIVLDNLNIFYIILESIGIYNKPGKLFSETYNQDILTF